MAAPKPKPQPRPDSTKPVFRFLPEAYRKAGRGSAFNDLTRALARSLDRVDKDLMAAVKARYLHQLSDPDDARRLGALLGEAPWRDESVAAFRLRLAGYARLILSGATNAARLLELVALATDARVIDRVGPRTDPADSKPPLDPRLATDRFQQRALLDWIQPASADQDPKHHSFIAEVEDQPLTTSEQQVLPTADGRLSWLVVNTAPYLPDDPFVIPPTPALGTQPRLVIETGERPLYAPLLLHHQARRAILINRVLPAGCTLELDLGADNGQVALFEHTPKRPSTAGPARLGEGCPLLLFGTGAILSRSRFPGPQTDTPAHWLRWYRADAIDPVQSLAAAGLADDSEAPPRLPWPPLIEVGQSSWSLLAADWCPDAGPRPVAELRFRHPGRAAPVRLRFQWSGRRPGTFTLRFDRHRGEPDGPALSAERLEWLDERIRRLSLAGTLYLPPGQTDTGRARDPSILRTTPGETCAGSETGGTPTDAPAQPTPASEPPSQPPATTEDDPDEPPGPATDADIDTGTDAHATPAPPQGAPAAGFHPLRPSAGLDLADQLAIAIQPADKPTTQPTDGTRFDLAAATLRGQAVLHCADRLLLARSSMGERRIDSEAGLTLGDGLAISLGRRPATDPLDREEHLHADDTLRFEIRRRTPP